MKFINLILFIIPFFVFSQEDRLSISMENGKSLYEDFCLRCHLPNGKGVKGIFPPLAKSDFLFKNMEKSIKAIKFGGIDGEIIVNGLKYNSKMEKMGLYDDEIADVMNYILNSWGNKHNKIIKEAYVKSLKK
ncbi:MAG: c-type cytochrome [Flavobacteriales bacterium]|jgi:mono/diheme cytochrome c family protein|tara:strand:+ start:279 stop:674 length:396 start_codon:yes stop_codon:yes gene_type:complete